MIAIMGSRTVMLWLVFAAGAAWAQVDAGEILAEARELAGAGRHAEAESYYLRALANRERALGADHRQVALVAHELARLYDRLGRRAEAVLLSERALRIREASGPAAAGASGPDVAPPPATGSGSPPAPPPAAGDAAVAGELGLGPLPDRVYRAQVASRQDRAMAEQDLAQLRREHPLVAGLRSRIARADLGAKGVWYRVQLGEFPAGAPARALCGELARRGHDGCFVIATPD